MYSRYQDSGKRPVRLPEHYSGSTFSQKPTEPITVSKREMSRPYPREGIGEKASPVADRMLRAEAVEDEVFDVPAEPSPPEEEEIEKEEKPDLPPPKAAPSSPINFGALSRLFSGGGDGDQDRLLLLGLILLLSRTQGESDILLWLSLLLLCG